MMNDIREKILVRLLAVVGSIEGVRTALRNSIGISDTARPAIIILDADEIANSDDPKSRPANAPRIITMTPEIYIMFGAAAENVGTEINLLRARLISAILTDEELINLTAEDKGIRYVGSLNALSLGRSMEGQMAVSFDFEYYLKIADLS